MLFSDSWLTWTTLLWNRTLSASGWDLLQWTQVIICMVTQIKYWYVALSGMCLVYCSVSFSQPRKWAVVKKKWIFVSGILCSWFHTVCWYNDPVPPVYASWQPLKHTQLLSQGMSVRLGVSLFYVCVSSDLSVCMFVTCLSMCMPLLF